MRVESHWEPDILRHTWMSARLAEVKNEAQVALEAGTSVDMIHAHYLSLTSAAEARALAALRPEKGLTPAPAARSVAG